MIKKIITLVMTLVLVLTLGACGTSAAENNIESNSSQNETTSTGTTSTDTSGETSLSDTSSSDTSSGETSFEALAEDEEALVNTYAGKFEQKTYTDSQCGLSITYNLYLPENYTDSGNYPMVVFIADSSCTGSNASVSLTQGRGALVWATDEWQTKYPTIVAVPTYPETILDDHGSYTTTEYVELTKRFIDHMKNTYAVDADRIYGTGQSMGCMTTLILASEYPDLYAACMFVDGQWDVSTLTGLEGQTFVYFAAEDDTNAWNGAQEVMKMFENDSVSYTLAQWDGNWSVSELTSAADQLFTSGEDQYFISWATGTIDASTGNSGMGAFGSFSGPSGSGGFGGPSGSSNSSGGFPGPGSTSSSSAPAGDMTGGASSGMNSSSYHMASFDYAYNCVAVMEWLFEQK